MSTLREYLAQKRQAIEAKKKEKAAGQAQPRTLHATVTAEGRSGVRRIRIRDFQILSDSGPDFAGYDLGPASPELQLGVLGSCLTHIFLIRAAELAIPLDSLQVQVEGAQDPRAGDPGFEEVPIYPHQIRYSVHIDSPATDEDLRRLHEEVERTCPIYNLLRNPQSIQGEVVREGAAR
jgi:uncharacterized OsmC-like protein